MDKNLIVSPSPHVHGQQTTSRLMLDVVIALLPALAVSTWVFGFSVLLVTCTSVACCVVFEYLIQRFLLRGPLTVNNWSAVVTGMLLAFNLPSSIPLWMVAVGALVSIGVGKMTFGGLGKNPFNPALVGRVFMLLSFPVAMTTFPEVADAATGATPLSAMKGALASGMTVPEAMRMFSYQDLLVGFKSGSFGEVSAVALLLGFVWLLVRRVITWRIPVYVLGTMALFTGILWAVNPDQYMSPVFHLLTGGALLGAIFMATDYVTSPMTNRGMLLYGIGIGAITVLIRIWGQYPEGMSFAILIMNAFVPPDRQICETTPLRCGQKSEGLTVMKSSLVNMVVVLLGITAVTSSAVGLVYRVTEAPIAQAKLHKKADALAQVLPPFDNTPADEMQAVAAGNDSVYVYTARMGQTVAGYAVESFASGFGGPIRIMVGFGPDGRIRNIQVLEQTETPGLGAKLAEEGNPVQASLLGKKSGGGEDVRA